MNDIWSTLGRTLGQAQVTLEEARKEAERLSREAQQQFTRSADAAGRGFQDAVAGATRGLADTAAQVAGAGSPLAQGLEQIHASLTPPPTPLDLTALPEHQRVALRWPDWTGTLIRMS